MNINVSPETEKFLTELAARSGKPVSDLAGYLLEEKVRETDPDLLINDDDDEDPDALQKAIAKMTNRTPDEIQQIRARLFQEMKSPRQLPEGKTLFDVLCGQWPGTETDEEVFEALRKLS